MRMIRTFLRKLRNYSSYFLTLFFLASCQENQKPALHIFSWSEMLSPELVQEFEEAFNCRVIIDLYDSNESMYAKLKLGYSSYDILFPSNYYLEIMEKQEMVRKLNLELIPNHIYLDPDYFNRKAPSFGIPFMISYSGLGYRADKLDKAPSSYTIFGSNRYTGRMTMLNDIREALGASLKALGHSVNTTAKEEIEAAANLLISWKKHLAKFENEQYKNGLVNREFLICQSYSSDILLVQEESDSIGFSFPEQGAILSIDYMAIPVNAPNTELAHAFINFMITPRIAAQNMQHTHALTPVVAGYQLLTGRLKNNPILFPSEEEKKKMELIRDVGTAVQLYYRAWERVKGTDG